MWKPGVSGNPGGRAKTKLFQQALRNVLSLSEAEDIARKVVQMAKAGDLVAANMVADRLDGKPQQSVEITDERSSGLAERFEEILSRAASEASAVHPTGGERGAGRIN